MVSFGAKVLAGVATFMSAPMVLPRSTLVTDAVAAIGAGAGIGAGSVAAGGIVVATGSSFFLQPTRATVPSTATNTTCGMRACRRLLRFMRAMSLCESGKGYEHGGPGRLTSRQSASPSPSRSMAGIFNTCPGWILSGSLS